MFIGDDIDLWIEKFHYIICAIFQSCFPEKFIRVRSNFPNWVGNDLLVLADLKDRAYKLKQHGKFITLRDQ